MAHILFRLSFSMMRLSPVKVMPYQAVAGLLVYWRGISHRFSREEAARQMGTLIRAKTLSNLDAGQGPKVKIRIRKKVRYERGSFLQRLRKHVQQ